jgi:uncharacterized damage-inducible protein DinB
MKNFKKSRTSEEPGYRLTRSWEDKMEIPAKLSGSRRNQLNCYGSKELAQSFRTVRKNTIAIAQDLPAEKYGFRVTPDTRSVGELLAHISLAYSFQYAIHAQEARSSLVGFDFPSLMQRMAAEEKVQRSKDQTLELLRSSGEKWAGWLDGLTDAFLAERVSMPPGAEPSSRSRFDMILSVKEHEMHHRGQLMLIERMVGIVPHLTREMQARMAAAAAPKS